MNECLEKKIEKYILELGLGDYIDVYIPKYIIEKFIIECDKNEKEI